MMTAYEVQATHKIVVTVDAQMVPLENPVPPDPQPPEEPTVIHADLHIDPAGSDETGDGTDVSPYATLAKALSTLPDSLSSACTIHAAAGAYQEPIVLRRFRSGPDARLTVEGDVSDPAATTFTWGNVAGGMYAALRGVRFNANGYTGVSIEDKADVVIDHCQVGGTISGNALSVQRYALARLKGDTLFEGWTGKGIDVGTWSSVFFDDAGTLRIVGPGSSGTGLYIGYQAMMVVGWCDGLHIEITNVHEGIVACLCSMFQHYANSGSISIKNTGQPKGGAACISGDISTWSTNQRLIIDNFKTALHAHAGAYIEAVGPRTFTNVG